MTFDLSPFFCFRYLFPTAIAPANIQQCTSITADGAATAGTCTLAAGDEGVSSKDFATNYRTRAASYEPPKSQEGEELSFCEVVFEPFEIPKCGAKPFISTQSAECLPAKPRDCATHDGFEMRAQISGLCDDWTAICIVFAQETSFAYRALSETTRKTPSTYLETIRKVVHLGPRIVLEEMLRMHATPSFHRDMSASREFEQTAWGSMVEQDGPEQWYRIGWDHPQLSFEPRHDLERDPGLAINKQVERNNCASQRTRVTDGIVDSKAWFTEDWSLRIVNSRSSVCREWRPTLFDSIRGSGAQPVTPAMPVEEL
ncbi:hypothetical protein B0H14DRAFT_3175416 [Mycena olivaceomarginata]|nr:hypothetical protein B0H14DRAFT_3175416 [Mycena olivaceomarginata]